jgi:two-component system LytT family response regulator
LKPISIDKLIEAVEYVTEIKQKENTLQDRVLKPRQLKVAGKITIPVQSGFEVLEVVNILYCQVDDN